MTINDNKKKWQGYCNSVAFDRNPWRGSDEFEPCLAKLGNLNWECQVFQEHKCHFLKYDVGALRQTQVVHFHTRKFKCPGDCLGRGCGSFEMTNAEGVLHSTHEFLRVTGV